MFGQEWCSRDFPGGPVVKTLTSTAGGMGSIPGQRTKILHALESKSKKKKKKKKTLKKIPFKKRMVQMGVQWREGRCYD